MVNVNLERNECQLIPAVKIEGDGHVTFEQSVRIDNATGKLKLFNRVSQSMRHREHPEITPHLQRLQNAPETQQSQPLAGPELDTVTVDHTRVDPSELVHHVSQSTPVTDRVSDLHLGREPQVVPEGNIGPFKSNTVHMHTLGSYAAEGGLAKVPILNSKGKVVSSTVS